MKNTGYHYDKTAHITITIYTMLCYLRGSCQRAGFSPLSMIRVLYHNHIASTGGGALSTGLLRGGCH